MGVPDFQTLMLPLLRLAVAGKTTIRDCIPEIAREFALTQADLDEMLPSGRQQTLANRLHWARTYLAKAGLLATVKRGVFAPSVTGREIIAANPPRIDMKFLERFEDYRGWRVDQFRSAEAVDDACAPADHTAQSIAQPPAATPEDRIAAAVIEMEAGLASDLLERLLSGSPAFFERAVVDVLVAMGYGRGRKGAGQRLGRSGDGGIDGVISEDPLGLDNVYVQAKRYAPGNTVGRPAIQQFVGALNELRASKGVFFTTSSFSGEAKRTVESVSQRVMLIDGNRLTRLMIAHGVGVRPVETITLSQIDENFFSEE
jgi:restriction system protein